MVAMLCPLVSLHQRWQRGIQWMYAGGLFGVYGWLGRLRQWW
jgi:hypothetical protein